MMFRLGFVKLTSNGLAKRLCKVTQIQNGQIAFISGKYMREKHRKPKPPPYPYNSKEPDTFEFLFDSMVQRFDENTKVVIVEGPIGAGKDKFAKKLAEELEMHYLPPCDHDNLYITPQGYDYRSLNSSFEEGQFMDVPMFLSDPRNRNVALMQQFYWQIRIRQYINALLHLLSTGEGVVLTRSHYSDHVYSKAMLNAGYISKQFYKYQLECNDNADKYLLHPHLTIYLDIPVDEVQARIKKRNIPYEVNSKVLTKEYLADIEHAYKEDCLPYLSVHSQILMLDATKPLDMEDIVWSIEEMDFESNHHKKKFSDWVFPMLDYLRSYRAWLHDERRDLGNIKKIYELPIHVPELLFNPYDMLVIQEAENDPAKLKYDPGYNNPNMMSYLFKSKNYTWAELEVMRDAAIAAKRAQQH